MRGRAARTRHYFAPRRAAISRLMGIRNLLKRWLAPRDESAARDAGRRAPGEELAPDEDESADPFNPFPEPVVLEITDVIDLHTIQPRDAKRAVEAYLEEAHRAGFRSVRIIHGKGRGVQREMVRKILSRTPFVAAFTDAPPHAGGLGATVAHLSKANRVDEEEETGSD